MRNCTRNRGCNDLRGLGSLYRIYDAANSYVFLAAPRESEWKRLATALAPYADLAGDPRFAETTARHANTSALIEALTEVFARKPAIDWERELLPAGIACVAVTTDSIESMMFEDSFGRASGYVADVVHPVFEEHPRLAPYVRFSRSLTQALPGVLAGDHTDALLAEAGCTPEQIADYRSRNIVC